LHNTEDFSPICRIDKDFPSFSKISSLENAETEDFFNTEALDELVVETVDETTLFNKVILGTT
jgi:hypothetical protein